MSAETSYVERKLQRKYIGPKEESVDQSDITVTLGDDTCDTV